MKPKHFGEKLVGRKQNLKRTPPRKTQSAFDEFAGFYRLGAKKQAIIASINAVLLAEVQSTFSRSFIIAIMIGVCIYVIHIDM